MKRIGQRFLLAAGLPWMFAACATIGPPQPPSLDLPKPPTDLRAVRKGDHVILTWTVPTLTTDRETIHKIGTTKICRAAGDLAACGPAAGEAPPHSVSNIGGKPESATHTDTLSAEMESDDPGSFITYAVEVANPDRRAAGLSNRVRVPATRTLPAPQGWRAAVTKQGVVLSWSGTNIPAAATDVRYFYRFYRRMEGSAALVLAGEIPAGVDTSGSITDASFEWEKTYYYHAEAVTQIPRANKSPLEVEGDDSPEVKVFVDDIFPPEVPSALQAVFSGPGQKPFIDLVWAPVADVDLAGYNVYRHEEGAAPVKLNSDLTKAPAYRDENVGAQRKYFYSVSAVDVHGNESARSEEATEVVP